MVYFIDMYSGFPVELPPALIWSMVAVVCSVFLSLYVLRAVGVYKLAKNKNVKNAVLAFFPFCWTLVAGNTIKDKFSFFGKKFKGFPIIFFIAYTVSELIVIALQVYTYFPVVSYYLSGVGTSSVIYIGTTEAIVQHVGSMVYEYPYAYNIYTAAQTLIYTKEVQMVAMGLSVVNRVVSLGVAFLEVVLFVNIFRLYWPRMSVVASILSVLGLFPIFVFIIRNNKQINTAEYYRAKTNNYYYYGGNPYGNNPYNNQNTETRRNTNANADPFSEFNGGGRPSEEPFDEFDGDNK